MKPRFAALVAVVLIALSAVIVYQKLQRPAPESPEEPTEQAEVVAEAEKYRTPPGREPDVEPEFECEIEVFKEGKREEARITVREVHGFYVEGAYVGFWHKDMLGEIRQGNRRPIQHVFEQPVPFDGSQTETITILPHEHAGIDLGTSEDWECEVARYGTVLAPPED